jgi:hypothetical protein
VLFRFRCGCQTVQSTGIKSDHRLDWKLEGHTSWEVGCRVRWWKQLQWWLDERHRWHLNFLKVGSENRGAESTVDRHQQTPSLGHNHTYRHSPLCLFGVISFCATPMTEKMWSALRKKRNSESLLKFWDSNLHANLPEPRQVSFFVEFISVLRFIYFLNSDNFVCRRLRGSQGHIQSSPIQCDIWDGDWITFYPVWSLNCITSDLL